MNDETKLPVRDGGRQAAPNGVWGRPQRRRRAAEPIMPTETLTERLLRRFRCLPRRVQAVTACAFAAVCLAVLLIPLFVLIGRGTGAGAGNASGGGYAGLSSGTAAETDAAASVSETTPAEPLGGETGTAPAVTESGTGAVPDGAESDAGSVPPDTEAGGTSSAPESETETSAEPESAEPESAEPESAEPETETEAGGSEEVSVPGTVRRDMSESERGPRYLRNDTDRDPLTLPAYVPDASPAVLLVCSQPYAAYADGDESGTVGNLTEQLAALLRAQGLPVVCVSAEMTGLSPADSLSDCRARVQALARYCCRLYGSITLILDLRRSAETAEGCLLAPVGSVDGTVTAQLRVIADARRAGADGESSRAASDADCALALALREALYRISPTAGRPVLWRASSGLLPADLCGSADGPRLLTVEVGAAGNLFSEAEAALPALAQALGEVICE